ncbi:hypothetical protein ABMC89_14475 [Sulfitobacter sp. HNIBRBA3233]|uniref:hypothetical protein n=1 Tax=Sulfitobacter marinivivus TaxID=3158558 RepID=UPI0032DF85E1
MQMICHFEVSDFTKWKTAFDADHEARRDAGLGVLQIWRDADSTSHAFVLLSVNDRDRAQAWIKRSDALKGDDGGTVSDESYYFIETA